MGVRDIVWQERAHTRVTQKTHTLALNLLWCVKIKAHGVIDVLIACHRERRSTPH